MKKGKPEMVMRNEERSEERLHVTEVEGHLKQSIHLSLIEKIVN
jgi:hypothetical protein